MIDFSILTAWLALVIGLAAAAGAIFPPKRWRR